MWMIRQGDVIIAQVAASDIPESATVAARDGGRVVLAYGEVTGHAHAIMDADVDLLSTADSEDRWLRVGGAGATVLHEEHAALAIPAGVYRVRIQREYRPEGIRSVAD